MESKALHQGHAAGVLGREYSNPFPVHTTNYHHYNMGFTKGRLDMQSVIQPTIDHVMRTNEDLLRHYEAESESNDKLIAVLKEAFSDSPGWRIAALAIIDDLISKRSN